MFAFGPTAPIHGWGCFFLYSVESSAGTLHIRAWKTSGTCERAANAEPGVTSQVIEKATEILMGFRHFCGGSRATSTAFVLVRLTGRTMSRRVSPVFAMLIKTIALVLLTCASVAAEEVRVYNLTAANTALCPTASCTSYAEVKLEINGNAATFTVTSPIGVGFFGNGGTMFGFNARDGSGKLLPLYVTSVSSALILQARSPSQVSQFGKFDYAITGPAANRALTSFSFTVTCSGCSATNPLTLGTFEFLPKPSGSYFAAHAICYTCGFRGTTGFVGNTVPIPNPEPASIALLGTGLAAVAAFLRNRS